MVFPGNSADTGKIERDQEEILKAIIKKIQQFLDRTNSSAKNNRHDSANKQSPKKISIDIDNERVFEANLTQLQKGASLNPENLQILKNAISNPYNNSHDIRIKLGKKTLFYAAKNKIVVDKLGLGQSTTLKQQASLEERLDQLTKVVAQQQDKITSLEQTIARMDKKLDFIAQSSSGIKNDKLKNWSSGLTYKIKSAWDNAKNSLKNLVNSQVQKGGEKLANFSAAILEKPVNFMLNRFGQEETPGIISFKGDKFTFNRNKESGEISIFSNNKQQNILEKGAFTSKASPEDIKILRTLPEKVSQAIAPNQSQKNVPRQAMG